MTNKRLLQIAFTATSIATFLGTQSNANAFTVSAFSPIGFTDEIAGISNFEIEDFEDTTLIPGLSVEWIGAAIGSVGPLTTLPNTVNNSDYWFAHNNAWDGTNLMGNLLGKHGYHRVNHNYTADITKFNFSNNPTSVGIGISNYQSTGATLIINDVVYGELSSIGSEVTRGLGKNVYLRIDAEEGEVINSISIDGRPADFLGFDRIAVGHAGVPEPFTILGTGTAIAFGAGFKRKLAKAKKK